MEQVQTLESLSKIHGKIEITFNTENKELDPYEMLENQVILTLGKTGRANRLTFKEFSPQDLRDLADSCEEIAERLEQIQPQEEEEEKTSEQGNRAKLMNDKLDEILGGGVVRDKNSACVEISEKTNIKKEKVEERINQLMREGEIFEPEPGKIKMMS